MAARVFISYSSRDDEAVALRDALEKALTDAGYEVFVDKRSIAPGEKWERKIRLALAESHAAILLLSKTTLDHDYVIHEAGFLSIRCDVEDGFQFIPVLFKEVTLDDLRSGRFSPLALANLQNVTVSSNEQIVEKILQLLGPEKGRVGHRTVVDSLVGEIAVELDEFKELRLKQLAARLDLKIPIWTRQRGISEIATEIARRVLHEGMAGVERSISTMIDARVPELEPLVQLLSPLWVRHEAAGRIKNARRRMVALNGVLFAEFTARMYLYRALWPKQAIQFCPIAETHSENRVAHVTDEIVKHVIAHSMYKKRAQALEYLRRRKEPLYVTLPSPIPEPEELEQLSTEFPHITFLLHTGEEALTADRLPALVEPLPELDLAEEQDACDKCSNIHGLLGIQSR